MLVKYALKNAANIDQNEATTIIIISALSGFILSFRKWGTESFNATEGLTNLAIYSIMVLFLFIIFILTQKFIASTLGLDAKIHIWKYGPPLGVLITMMTYGAIPFIFMGGLYFKEIPRLRLGKLRQVVNIKDMMMIGISGPVMLVLLSLLIFFPLYKITNNFLFMNLINISSLILIFSAIPLPSLNGMNILLRSRGLWLIYLLYVLFLFILLNLLEHIASYIIALGLSILTALLIKKLIDKQQ